MDMSITQSLTLTNSESKSHLIQEYLSLDKQQIVYTKSLLRKHSKRELPDIHPEQERFELLKTLEALAYNIAHPDTVTRLIEEINWWGLHYETNFEPVNIAIRSSSFRREQYQILASLGYEAAKNTITSAAHELPFGPYVHMREHSFIDDLIKDLIPPIAIEALQIIPSERIQDLAPELCITIVKLSSIQQVSVLSFDLECDQWQCERDIRYRLAERGLTPQDFLEGQTPEQAIAAHNRRQAWLKQLSQTRKVLNALPFLQRFHCAGCGVQCMDDYCDRCQPVVDDINKAVVK